MVMPKTWFKAEEWRLKQPPYLQYVFVTCRFVDGPTYILYHYISSFREALYHIVFSPVFGGLEFYLEMEMKMKELGTSTWNNTKNITSLICTPQVCHRRLAVGRSLHSGRVSTHAHARTHTHTNRYSGIVKAFENAEKLMVKFLVE